MKRPPDTYGDNFPVADGFSWDPRIPWRRAHVHPGRKMPWLRWLGWWTLVMALMAALLVLVTHDGFSEEMPFPGWQPAHSGELVVRFKEGALTYPEGASRVLIHRVIFRPASLEILNTRYGLIAMEKVKKPDQPTQRLYRLRFASESGLERALSDYRKNPWVISAEVVNRNASPPVRPPAALYTRDA